MAQLEAESSLLPAAAAVAFPTLAVLAVLAAVIMCFIQQLQEMEL